jgi:hypothetical protein
MIDISDPQTFWVSTTNVVLGIVTLCCAALLGSVVVNELLERWVGRVLGSTATDPHTIGVRELGLTMADGGERVDDEDAGGVDHWGF